MGHSVAASAAQPRQAARDLDARIRHVDWHTLRDFIRRHPWETAVIVALFLVGTTYKVLQRQIG